jgi:predicted component of type VI protein secretion system
METASRPETTDLIRELQAKPFGFDFFRAVRLLEALYASGPRLGESLTPRTDPIRFGRSHRSPSPPPPSRRSSPVAKAALFPSQ